MMKLCVGLYQHCKHLFLCTFLRFIRRFQGKIITIFASKINFEQFYRHRQHRPPHPHSSPFTSHGIGTNQSHRPLPAESLNKPVKNFDRYVRGKLTDKKHTPIISVKQLFLGRKSTGNNSDFTSIVMREIVITWNIPQLNGFQIGWILGAFLVTLKKRCHREVNKCKRFVTVLTMIMTGVSPQYCTFL